MSQRTTDDDGATGRPTREAARGRSERTPFLIIGGVAGTIAVVAGTLAAILLLLWWAL